MPCKGITEAYIWWIIIMINLTSIRLILQHPFHLYNYMVSGVSASFLRADVNIVEYVTQKKQEINKQMWC